MQKLRVVMMMCVWAMPVVAGERAVLPGELSRPTLPAGKHLWQASVAALAAANVMDAESSWGKHELNPNLSGNNGNFGRQGAVLKLGIVGGMFVLESLVLRHKPSTRWYRGLALVNFGSASVTAAVAIRNYGVPRQ
jgi:hypothetical protein